MTAHAPSLSILTRALEREADIARSLARALAEQRDAVGRNDAAAVEAIAAEMTRILSALEQSHGARTELLRSLAGEGQGFARLTASDDPDAPRLAAARARLAEALEHASREARRQQRVLQGALAAGEALLVGMFEACAPTARTYAETGAPAPAGGRAGVLVDRAL